MPSKLLRDMDLKNAKVEPGKKINKLRDGDGLQCVVDGKGHKRWRLAYRFDGNQKTLSLGSYPRVSLVNARKLANAAREQILHGIDPVEHRRQEKQAKRLSTASEDETLKAVAEEWFAQNSKQRWSRSYQDAIRGRLERNVLPYLGDRPIADIRAPELLAVLRRIEAVGKLETAHRVRGLVGQVFRYAIATGKAERDISADLRGALAPTSKKHFAAITEPRAVGELLRAIDGYAGDPVTCAALKLTPLVFVRPGELRAAEWSEVDFDAALWRIPGQKMKMDEAHVVPLSAQAIAILRDIQLLTGNGRYVFPGARSDKRPMSENAMTAALRRMGYTGDQMTAHGFRRTASTLLNEQGWNRDAIERQLAHAERNEVRAAYNAAEYLPERTKMMQAWADYLDSIKHGAEVVPIHSKRA